MSPMETFIVVVALACSFGGGLILLSCLAGKRANLMRHFNEEERTAEREENIKALADTPAPADAPNAVPAVPVA